LTFAHQKSKSKVKVTHCVSVSLCVWSTQLILYHRRNYSTCSSLRMHVACRADDRAGPSKQYDCGGPWTSRGPWADQLSQWPTNHGILYSSNYTGFHGPTQHEPRTLLDVLSMDGAEW